MGTTMGSGFDPGAAAAPDSGIFGLADAADAARVVVVPVPFAATTSYGGGAQRGPATILHASHQVDLFDVEIGRPYEAGIHMLELPHDVEAWDAEARGLAAQIIETGGRIEEHPALERALARVNEIGILLNDRVYKTVREQMAAGKLVALVGGDHATPYGAIRAHAEAYAQRGAPLGVLHIDAHADLRDAYEGFTYSHASIMFNVVTRIPEVARVVQVGVRDLSEDELRVIAASKGRIVTHFDAELAARKHAGEPWAAQMARIANDLPQYVYVSFDVDGLDPTLCPHTGTPVPGGLSFHEATALLGAIVRSGRTIVGCDLNEVVPGPDGDEWDGNVGARILYKMIGWMLVSQDVIKAPPRIGALPP